MASETPLIGTPLVGRAVSYEPHLSVQSTSPPFNKCCRRVSTFKDQTCPILRQFAPSFRVSLPIINQLGA